MPEFGPGPDGGGSGGSAPVTVIGTWVGVDTVPELGTESKLTLVLRQSGSNVTGSWKLEDMEGVDLFHGSVTGSYLSGNVDLTLRRVGAAAVTATGGVSSNWTSLRLSVETLGWTPTEFLLGQQ
jgi:hypothetical protein